MVFIHLEHSQLNLSVSVKNALRGRLEAITCGNVYLTPGAGPNTATFFWTFDGCKPVEFDVPFAELEHLSTATAAADRFLDVWRKAYGSFSAS